MSSRLHEDLQRLQGSSLPHLDVLSYLFQHEQVQRRHEAVDDEPDLLDVVKGGLVEV